jgi:hypothetical protein
MVSGPEFAAAQRTRLIADLQLARTQGLKAVQQLLERVDPKDLDRWWPLIAPLLEDLIYNLQRAGRNSTLTYVGLLGTAMGAGAVMARPSQAMLARDRMLPSGMPVSRLVRSAPMAMAHRIENGMSPAQAWQVTTSHLVSAVADAVHDESRKTASDVLKAGGVDWEQMDAQFEENLWDIRQRKLWEEQRRIRRNMSPRGQAALKSVWTEAWAVRYIRVPSANACPFCLMLATKGPKYYGDSFKDSNKRFRGNGDAKAHAHCQCVLVPEPTPGAFRGVVPGNAEQYEGVVWRDNRYKRDYDLSKFASRVAALPKTPSRIPAAV